jgi:hypothetical protein
VETTGPPRFLEDPALNVPCSPTPVGPPRSAATALPSRLPPIGKRRLPRQILISGLNHTACSLAVYASQGGLLHHHARLASGWLASLVRAGLTTRWVLPKGFRSSILLSQASPGAPKSEYRNQGRAVEAKIRDMFGSHELPRGKSPQCVGFHWKRTCLSSAVYNKTRER